MFDDLCQTFALVFHHVSLSLVRMSPQYFTVSHFPADAASLMQAIPLFISNGVHFKEQIMLTHHIKEYFCFSKQASHLSLNGKTHDRQTENKSMPFFVCYYA